MAVSKAAAAGRITLEGGKINPKTADAEWSQNTRTPLNKAGLNASTVATPRARINTSDMETMADAQLRHESAKALKAEMEVAKLEGKLLDIEDVKNTWNRHRDAIKGRLMLLEAKVPQEARAIVAREVRAALNELVDMQDIA